MNEYVQILQISKDVAKNPYPSFVAHSKYLLVSGRKYHYRRLQIRTRKILRDRNSDRKQYIEDGYESKQITDTAFGRSHWHSAYCELHEILLETL